MSYSWYAFFFFVAAAGGAAVFAVLRALDCWRSLRRLRRVVGIRADSVNYRLAGLEERAAALPARAAELQEALARLAESTRRARLVSAAVTDALDSLAGARALVPRK